jgi:hypothetical protein
MLPIITALREAQLGMPFDFDPGKRDPESARQQRTTLALLTVVAGLLLAMVIVVAVQRFA